jgi:hypothetical protein
MSLHIVGDLSEYLKREFFGSIMGLEASSARSTGGAFAWIIKGIR